LEAFQQTTCSLAHLAGENQLSSLAWQLATETNMVQNKLILTHHDKQSNWCIIITHISKKSFAMKTVNSTIHRRWIGKTHESTPYFDFPIDIIRLIIIADIFSLQDILSL
jgi:hypothetical protein